MEAYIAFLYNFKVYLYTSSFLHCLPSRIYDYLLGGPGFGSTSPLRRSLSWSDIRSLQPPMLET